MAQPTKNRFIDHLAEGNDAESFFAAGQRNDARATMRDPHTRFCKLQLQSSASAQGPNGTALALRDFDLGGAKPILPGGRSVRCSLLNQQAFRLEKKFEMDHGFHRTPLVPGCLEALQYVSPGVARSVQCHLPNKTYSLCCAAQYYWRARADTQLRINWEVVSQDYKLCFHCAVKPLTRSHRAGFQSYWRERSRTPVGRPRISAELRNLIGAMSRANDLWGAPHIHGELLKLGFTIAQSTVARYMYRGWPPSQGWRTFLTNHVDGIAAIDLFVMPTFTFRVL
jgi:hypothetical protein